MNFPNFVLRKRRIEDARKLYFNQLAPGGQSTNDGHYHVNDYRKVLRKDFPQEEQVYTALCEFVDPNYGSNYLVSSGTFGVGKLDRPYSEYGPQIAFANLCIQTCLELANR